MLRLSLFSLLFLVSCNWARLSDRPGFRPLPAIDVTPQIINQKPLLNFQVKEPTLLASHRPDHNTNVIRHAFGNSWNAPAIADYHPPDWIDQCSAVVLNLTITSNGTQYDRLASLYLHHVEILRTSTAEPTRNGIIWTIEKDVTDYLPLFKQSGPVLFDLGNLLDLPHNLTGIFDVSIDFNFYKASTVEERQPRAHLILPLSNLGTDEANYFSVNGDREGITNVTIPQNAVRALVEIYASGNAFEEFWYMNAPTSVAQKLGSGGLLGAGAYREIQVRIDGKLAGVILPFPVIYTGGIITAAWRPMAAYGAFDQPSYWLDISPWLPLLCHKPVNISLSVKGPEASHAILENWFVSGNVQIYLGRSPERTRGKMTIYSIESFPATLSSTDVSKDRLEADVFFRATRNVHIESELWLGGQRTASSLRQNFIYENTQRYAEGGLIEHVDQFTQGQTQSSFGLFDQVSFPISVFSNYSAAERRFTADIDHSYERKIGIDQLHQRWSTRQAASGTITLNEIGRVVSGNGTTWQNFTFQDSVQGKYTRNVKVNNTQIVYDEMKNALNVGYIEWQ